MLEILVRSPSIRRERNRFDVMSRSLSWQINFVNHSEFLQRFLVLFQISSICSTFDFQINVSSCLKCLFHHSMRLPQSFYNVHKQQWQMQIQFTFRLSKGHWQVCNNNQPKADAISEGIRWSVLNTKCANQSDRSPNPIPRFACHLIDPLMLTKPPKYTRLG